MTTIDAQQQMQEQDQAFRRLAIQDSTDISGVISELRRQKQRARDYVVPAHKMWMHHPTPQTTDEEYQPKMAFEIPVELGQTQEGRPIVDSLVDGIPAMFGMNKIAHEQLADITGIGSYYYRKLRSNQDHRFLLQENVNYWLARMEGKKLLVRTLDDNIRAVLSNRYFIIDSYDVMLNTAVVVQQTPGALLQRLDVTEEKFYARIVHVDHAVRLERQADNVRALSRDRTFFQRGPVSLNTMFRDIALHPDWVVPGVIISNSEVGRGGLTIQPFMFQTWCLNTATKEKAFGRIHRGSELDDMLSDDTRRKQRDAIIGEIRDVITATFDTQKWRNHVYEYLGLQQKELSEDVLNDGVKLMKRVDSSFTELEVQQILNGLITQREGNTAWALVNAVTEYAHKQPDADRRVELEQIGGRMIDNFPRELVAVRR